MSGVNFGQNLTPGTEYTDGSAFVSTSKGSLIMVRNGSTIIPALADGSGNVSVNLVHVPHVVDTNNSTTTSLGISSVFSGSGVEVGEYSAILVEVNSDEDSADNGMDIEFSQDNTNWDISEPYHITADDEKAFLVLPRGRYFRIVYTNGATAQSDFRLQTTLYLNRNTAVVNYPQKKTVLLENLVDLYDDSPTSNTSQIIDVRPYRKGSCQISVTKAGSPTRFEVIVDAIAPDGVSRQIRNWALGKLEFKNTTSFAYEFDLGSIEFIEVTFTATGTDGSNTYDVTGAWLGLGS